MKKCLGENGKREKNDSLEAGTKTRQAHKKLCFQNCSLPVGLYLDLVIYPNMHHPILKAYRLVNRVRVHCGDPAS